MLQPLQLVEPRTVAEASAELRRLGEGARIYAGGVELLLLLRQQLADADCLVNIKRIPGLDEIRWEGDAVHIGATVTHRRLEREELIRQRLPLLAQAAAHVGNIRIRSQGTIGGNLCFADPHADPGTALLVYDAQVVVAGSAGVRQMPLEDFLVGMYTVALEPDEVLTEVVAAPLDESWGNAYLRLEQFYRPTLNVAAAVRATDGSVQAARLVVGCVGPRPIRLRQLEAQLQNVSLAAAARIIDGSAEYLAEALQPVGDALGSAEYKLTVTAVYLRRALEQAVRHG